MRILAIKTIKLNKAYSWQNCKYVILPNYYNNKPLLTSWFKFSVTDRHIDSSTPLTFIHSFIHAKAFTNHAPACVLVR